MNSNVTVTRNSSKQSLKQSASVERLHMGFLGSSASTAKQILLKKTDKGNSKLGKKKIASKLMSEDYNHSMINERNDSIESFN